MPNTRTANAVRLEFAPDSLVQANLERMAVADGFLCVVGSRGLTCKNGEHTVFGDLLHHD